MGTNLREQSLTINQNYFKKKNAQLAIATCQSGGAYGGYTCMCQDVSIARHQFDLLPWLKSNN